MLMVFPSFFLISNFLVYLFFLLVFPPFFYIYLSLFFLFPTPFGFLSPIAPLSHSRPSFLFLLTFSSHPLLFFSCSLFFFSSLLLYLLSCSCLLCSSIFLSILFSPVSSWLTPLPLSSLFLSFFLSVHPLLSSFSHFISPSHFTFYLLTFLSHLLFS